MPIRVKANTPPRPRRRLPTPDAVGVLDDNGRVVAWDLRATHALEREMGRPTGCDDACRARHCIAPVHDGIVFRRAIAPNVSPAAAVGDEVVSRWLQRHPSPIVNVPGCGGFEPVDGCTVVDVVRAAVREGAW